MGFFKWRRRKRQAYVNAQGRDDSFYESYPSSPGEAFINSGDCAFPKKCLNEQERENCIDPILIGEITYTSPEGPQDISSLRKPSPDEILDKPEMHDRLWVWELPEDDTAVEYYLAADISSGESRDYTDITVYRIGYGMDPTVQVAEWHGLINPSYAARIIVALGYWYHTCEVAVEYAVSGITTCNEIQWHLDYPAIYRWRRQDKIGNSMTMHTHWMTNHLTREDMINRMYESLLDKTIVIRNKHLIEEMRDFGRSSFDTRAEAMSGNDDMTMSNMIAICALHQSGKRQEWAENSSINAGSSGKHVNLISKTPTLFQIHNSTGQVINRAWIDGKSDPIDSEEMGRQLIAIMAKKMNIPNLSAQWRVVPILITRANSIWSPIFDGSSAEHELARLHGMTGMEQMKNMDTVYNYRKFLHVQSKFGNPTELLENVMDDGVTSMGMNGNGDDE
jgi:hypothetical protein